MSGVGCGCRVYVECILEADLSDASVSEGAYLMAKETHLMAKETHLMAREAHLTAKETLYRAREAYERRHT